MDEHNGREIISIEADEKRPDTYGLERFMEEVNILELEGFYFCPNRKEATKRSGVKKLAELADHPVTIDLSGYGQPGELAYKALQAIFLKLSEQGHDTDGIVSFSRRDLASLLGNSFGGRQSEQIYTALMQLHRTGITCAVRFKERQGQNWVKKWRTVSFVMLPTVAFEGSRGRFARVVIEVDRKIVQNFKNRHISYFNFERMRGLDMVGMMLYKRFFRHLANIYRDGMDRDRLKLEKDCEQVCSLWLGLKPVKHRSLLERKLGTRLAALKERRLLRECRIEPRADGGLKLVGYAGAGFFKDYENIYRRALPAPATKETEPEPLLFLADFHRRMGRPQHEFSAKEVAYTRELLARYQPADVRDFVDYALDQAKDTKFAMQWFGGISVYEAEWKLKREQARALSLRHEVVASCDYCNEHGFLEFIDGSVTPCPHDMERVELIHTQKPIRGFGI